MGGLDSPTRMLRRDSPPSVCVYPSKVARGRPDHRLRHAEQDVRPHDVDDVIEHRRAIHQVDERLVVGQEVAPVHETGRVQVLGVVEPAVVTPRQLRSAVRFPSRHRADAVYLARKELDLIGVKHPFQVKVTVRCPLSALFGSQFMHGFVPAGQDTTFAPRGGRVQPAQYGSRPLLLSTTSPANGAMHGTPAVPRPVSGEV